MASLTDMDLESSALYRNPKPTTIDLVGGINCHICHITYANKRDYDTHYVKHQTGSKGIIYTCVVCHKEIAGYPSFRGHCYTKHVIKERFKCEYCSKLFSKSPALKEHINVMHRFKCSSCKKEFTSKKECQLHQIIHNNTDMPPFKCQACYNQIDSLESCKDHIDLHSASVYFCPICNENISSRENAKEHLQKHFRDDGNEQSPLMTAFDKGESYIEQLGGISCTYCPLTFKDRVEFDAHFSCEHGNEDIVYTCNVCGRQFEKYSVFSDHSYNHFMRDRFCCDICHKTFSRLSLLVTHISACQANTESNGKPFECNQCGHRYATEARLREHLRDFHNIYCIICPENDCHKIFSRPKDLINHQRERHSQQNWCRQCGLLFLTLQSCERHLDLHKKKLYVCPVCSRNYSEKHLILKHVPQHFESVLHLCKVCGKVYNAKNRLIEHNKTHSETKSHTCTYCGKGFVKITQLQQHINIHTGSKPYKCPICSKSFVSYPNWHKHMRRIHEVDGKKFKKETDKASNIIDDSEYESVDNLDGEESPTEIELKENNAKQLTTEIPLEQVDTFPNTELHVGTSDAYVLQELDTSTMDSDKGFVKFTQLQEHVNIHNDSKSYKCSICSKSFASHQNCRKHMRRMHEVAGTKIKNETIYTEDSVDNLDGEESPTEIEFKENNSKQLKTEYPLEQVDTFSNTELHVGISDAYVLQEPDDSTMESDSIDQIIIEKELEIFKDAKNENMKNIFEFINILPNNNPTLVSAESAGPPAEYGPEFVTPEPLPHIDPLLTIKPAQQAWPAPWETSWEAPWEAPWEPHITRVFDEAPGRLSLMNTDIF